MAEIGWFDERGDPMTVPAWQDRERRALTMRRVGTGRTGRTEALLVMLNASSETVVPPAPALDYRVLVDTATPDAGRARGRPTADVRTRARSRWPPCCPTCLRETRHEITPRRPSGSMFDTSFGATCVGRPHALPGAPASRTAAVEIEGENRPAVPMTALGDGWFEAIVPCGPGTLYRYRLDGDLAVPDPASRFQPGGVDGPSQAVDPAGTAGATTRRAARGTRPCCTNCTSALAAATRASNGGCRRSPRSA